MKSSKYGMRAHIPWLLCSVALGFAPAYAGQMKWQLPQVTKQLQMQSTAETETSSSTQSDTSAAGARQGGWILTNRSMQIVDAGGQERVVPANRPFNRLFQGASAVATGFSGAKFHKPLTRGGRPNPSARREDTTYIDLDGISASLTQLDDLGFAMNGNEIDRRPYDMILARDVGQVFGVAIDDQDKPNLYLAATSIFGLPIIGLDENGDGQPDRLRKGAEKARWMPGLFGAKPGTGPGTIWRVDGTNGQITPFASIQLNGVDNAGPGLGNLAYDAKHKQIFVSDLDTGMVHRLDLDGNDLGLFDHGVSARPNEGLAPAAFDPANRLDIKDTAFDTEDPASWHYASEDRRVWGLAVYQGRLYYAVAKGPQIWSVGLDPQSGDFLEDARWELNVEDRFGENEISDLAFASDGSLLLAQRGETLGSYDFSALVKSGKSRILRYSLENPDDANTRSRWVEAAPMRHAVGFSGSSDNASGGLALGPGYDEEGKLDWRQCSSTLWTSGEALRKNRDMITALSAGGSLFVDGLQAQPLGLPSDMNMPPWISYFFDYDGKLPDSSKILTGHIGDVEVLGCHGTASGGYGDPALYGGDFFDPGTAFDPGAPEWADLPDYDPYYPQGDPDDSPDGEWWPCLINPRLCEIPQSKSCLKTKTKLVCDKETGTYVVKVTAADDLSNGFDMIDVTNPGGVLSGVPAESQPFPGSIALPATGMVAGQVGQLDLCAFSADDKASGNPYDCCKTSVTFQIPALACKKEGE